MQKTFKLTAKVSSDNPSAIKPVLEKLVSGKGSLKPADDGFEVNAEFIGGTSKELNRTLLSELRRAEKKTRLRSEWTCDGTTEKYFDYVLKQTRKV